MTGRIPKGAAKLGVAILAATALAAVAAGTASAEVVYNNIPSPLPGSFASIALDATSTTEFGGAVELAGTARAKPTVTVGMSVWACESGSIEGPTCITLHPTKKVKVPVTIRIYGAHELNEAPFGEKTKNVKLTYRPTATTPSTPVEESISIKLPKLKKMPKDAVITVSYPKTTPFEQSLNIGVAAPETTNYQPVADPATVGSQPSPQWVSNSTWGGMFETGVTPNGTLKYEGGLNSSEGEGYAYQPLFTVSAE